MTNAGNEADAFADERGRGHAADADERELPERELAGPTGEHGERERDHRVEQHAAPRFALRREVEEDEREQRDEHDDEPARDREPSDPPQTFEPGWDRADPRCEGPASAVGLGEAAAASAQQEGDEDDDEQERVEQAPLVVVVVGDEALRHADRDAARERDRKRRHARDEGHGEDP